MATSISKTFSIHTRTGAVERNQVTQAGRYPHDCLFGAVNQQCRDLEPTSPVYGNAKKPWLQGFLELPTVFLPHDTFGRVFAALDP